LASLRSTTGGVPLCQCGALVSTRRSEFRLRHSATLAVRQVTLRRSVSRCSLFVALESWHYDGAVRYFIYGSVALCGSAVVLYGQKCKDVSCSRVRRLLVARLPDKSVIGCARDYVVDTFCFSLRFSPFLAGSQNSFFGIIPNRQIIIIIIIIIIRLIWID